MNPKFSLIIPIYNVEPYLRKCLDSIWVQDYQNWEALLIDDGSPDNSPSICDEYSQKDSRFRVFHKSNGGVSSARNVGLDNAQGDWVWFVDPDDWIHPSALDFLSSAIDDYACDTVFFGIEYYDENGSLIGQENRELITDKSKDDTIQLADYPPQNYLLNRAVLESRNIRFTEGVAVGEDLEYQYKYLMTCNRPISIPYRLYMCLRREGSAMRNPNSLHNSAENSIVTARNIATFIADYHIQESDWLIARLQRKFKSVIANNMLVENVDWKKVKICLDFYDRQISNTGFEKFRTFQISLALYCFPLYRLLFRIIRR